MTTMTTLREELNGQEFNFSSGQIVYKPRSFEDFEHFAQYEHYEPSQAFCVQNKAERPVARVLAHDDPIMDINYHDGHGASCQPLIFAEDANSIFFYVAYDGATWMNSVCKNINAYLTGDLDIPVMG